MRLQGDDQDVSLWSIVGDLWVGVWRDVFRPMVGIAVALTLAACLLLFPFIALGWIALPFALAQ